MDFEHIMRYTHIYFHYSLFPPSPLFPLVVLFDVEPIILCCYVIFYFIFVYLFLLSSYCYTWGTL
jgi:hypothetical protein